MLPIRTALIGLGNIGALYDLQSGDKDAPLSHLKALVQNLSYEVIALVDPDVEKHQAVKARYGFSERLFCKDIEWLRDGAQCSSVDLVVFASPPEQRLEDLRIILEFRPRHIVFEKPLALNSEDAKAFAGLCDKKNIIVNFHRRYDGDHQAFKRQLPSVAPKKIMFNYTKGIWNYGSHGIDLITHWFGEVENVCEAVISKDGKDPLVDAIIMLKSGTIVHFCGHSVAYDLFEFEFFYETEKYSLLNGGISKIKQGTISDQYHRNYKHLVDGENVFPPSKVFGLENLYTNLAERYIDSTVPIVGCSVEQAVRNVEIIEEIIRKAEK